jgi:RimJ/RimL family protein N-acetyltransferase
MRTAPTLTDGDVTLRAHRPTDVQGVLEQSRDPASQHWTTIPVPYDRAMAESFVGGTMAQGWLDDTEWGFAIEVGGQYAGTCSLRNLGTARAEIGFGSHPGIRGTGVVGRALRLLVDWGFREKRLHAIVWWAHVGNWASRKAAWRLGFTVEGTVRASQPQRGELRDSWVGTLLRDDPREPRRAWLTVTVSDADGLRLRAPRESDVPRIVQACSDPVTQQWLGRLPSPYDVTSARAWLHDCQDRLATGTGTDWVVVDPVDDVVLGSVGFFDLVPGVDCEVGYWTHPDARGRGVATRATTAVLRHAFEVLHLQRVRAFAAVDNTASCRVLEAVGMTRTGIERQGARVRDGVSDRALYDVLATEWAPAGAVASVRR